jgi:hypothetical protein
VLNTIREITMDLEPMTRDVISGIPEYKFMIDKLKKEGLFDVVWTIIGGVPAH